MHAHSEVVRLSEELSKYFSEMPLLPHRTGYTLHSYGVAANGVPWWLLLHNRGKFLLRLDGDAAVECFDDFAAEGGAAIEHIEDVRLEAAETVIRRLYALRFAIEELMPEARRRVLHKGKVFASHADVALAAGTGKRLYWVTDPWHDEDWFVVAHSRAEAEAFYVDYEGMTYGDAHAEFLKRIPEEASVPQVPSHPEVGTLRECGLRNGSKSTSQRTWVDPVTQRAFEEGGLQSGIDGALAMRARDSSGEHIQ
jgi:hypothetical protein